MIRWFHIREEFNFGLTLRVEEEIILLMSHKKNKQLMMQIKMIATRRLRRETWIAYMVVTFALSDANNDIPNIFNEIVRKSESDQQKLAIKEEVKAIYQNQTWELVKLPRALRASGNKNGYTKK